MHWIDPDSLPETKHRVGQFLLDADGRLDGFMCTDGCQVHFPPHMSAAVAKAVAVGDRVGVRGVRPRGADVLAAVSIQPKDRARIEDAGPRQAGRPPHARASALPTQEIESICEKVLFAPRGERAGVLLADGTVVRFSPDAADGLAEFLRSGTPLVVSGKLRITRWGSVLDADYFWHPES